MTKVYSRIPPQWKTSDFRWPKFTLEYPPNEKLQIWDDQSLLWNTPPPPTNDKLQIWDDQSLLRNTPAPMKNFIFEMTKVYSGIPPPMKNWKTSYLRWPKFTPEYPPNDKLHIWDDQSLLRNTPQWKTSDLRWPKFTPEYPPNEKLQIWDDQSLLQNTPLMKNFRFEMTKVYSRMHPPWKTSDLRWPKFTLEYPPQWKTEKLHIWDDQSLLQNTPQMTNFIFEMTKVYSGIPPNEKLQTWDDQSLLRNTPPMKNFRFEMTKVYSRIPP